MGKYHGMGISRLLERAAPVAQHAHRHRRRALPTLRPQSDPARAGDALMIVNHQTSNYRSGRNDSNARASYSNFGAFTVS